jgi:hypothetical protein
MERTGFGWHRVGSVADFCEHVNKLSGSIKKVGHFLTG